MDAGNELQQRALARAVAANEAERLAVFDAKRDIPERPELFDRLPLIRMKEAQEADLELGRRIVPEQELLRNRLRFDDGHYNCSVNRSSKARKSSAPTMNAPKA